MGAYTLLLFLSCMFDGRIHFAAVSIVYMFDGSIHFAAVSIVYV